MASPDTQWPRYEVFQQSRPGGPYQSVGSVHAPDAEIALQNARDVFVRRPQTVSLWVVPAEQILARTQEELEEDDAREPTACDSAARRLTTNLGWAGMPLSGSPASLAMDHPYRMSRTA